MLYIVAAALFLAGCAESTPERPTAPASGTASSVWSRDLVRTLPGQQAAYLRSIEANWAGARRIAQDCQAELSYHAPVAAPDAARGWDVVLLTEHADSAAWANREAIFDSIFASPDFVPVPTARPSQELRAFAVGGVVLEEVVGSPVR